MANNLLKKYLWLINTIRTFGPISYEEINALWLRSRLNEYGEELPKKTFRNHLEAIQGTFDMRIVCERKGGYKYSILEDEQQDRWLSRFLDTLSVQTAIEEDPLLKDRIIDYDVKHHPLLPIMVQFVKQRTVIQFRVFISLEEARKDPSMRNCEDIDFRYEYYCPLAMLQAAEHWYVIGQFTTKSKWSGQIRTFRLEDISEVCEMIGETATNYPDNFSLKKHIEELDLNHIHSFFDDDYLLYSDLIMLGIKKLPAMDESEIEE